MDAATLKRIPLFEGLSERDLERLAPMMAEVKVGENRPLTVEDAVGYEFFLLLEGTCEVRVGENVVARFGPGDFFGEIAPLERDRRTASVVATAPARVAMMSRPAFRDMSIRYPEIGARLRVAMDERMPRAGD